MESDSRFLIRIVALLTAIIFSGNQIVFADGVLTQEYTPNPNQPVVSAVTAEDEGSKQSKASQLAVSLTSLDFLQQNSPLSRSGSVDDASGDAVGASGEDVPLALYDKIPARIQSETSVYDLYTLVRVKETKDKLGRVTYLKEKVYDRSENYLYQVVRSSIQYNGATDTVLSYKESFVMADKTELAGVYKDGIYQLRGTVRTELAVKQSVWRYMECSVGQRLFLDSGRTETGEYANGIVTGYGESREVGAFRVVRYFEKFDKEGRETDFEEQVYDTSGQALYSVVRSSVSFDKGSGDLDKYTEKLTFQNGQKLTLGYNRLKGCIVSGKLEDKTVVSATLPLTSLKLKAPKGLVYDAKARLFLVYPEARGKYLSFGLDGKLTDKMVPAGSLVINDNHSFTNTRAVSLRLTGEDDQYGLLAMRFSVDGGQTWTSWEEWKEGKSLELKGTDGVKSVFYELKDVAGNVVRIVKEITLDTHAPVVVLKTVIPAWTNDPMFEMTYTVDGIEKHGAFNLEEGENQFSITETDLAGNTTTLPLPKMKLDTVNPIGSVLINGGAEHTDSRTVNLALTATDERSGLDWVRYSVDNGATWTSWEAFGTTKSVELPAGDGEKTVQYQVRDRAGNISNTGTDAIILDMTAPVVVIDPATPAKIGVNHLMVSYTLDGVVKTKEFTSLSDGLNNLKITEMDEFSRTTEVLVNITVDTTAPVVVIDPATPSLINAKILTVNYTVDGVTKTREFEDLAEGMHTLTITVADEFGRSTTKNLSVTVDMTPPDIMVTSVVPSLTNQGTLVVDYTSDGVLKQKIFTLVEGDNKNLTITEADLATNSRTITLGNVVLDTISPTIFVTSAVPSLTNQSTLVVDYTVDGLVKQKTFDLEEGDNSNLTITESDLANNLQTFGLPKVVLDTVKPTGSVLVNDGAEYTNSRTVNLALTATDERSGIDQVRYSVDNGTTWSEWEVFGATKSVELPAGEGEKTVKYEVKDKAGNVSVAGSDKIILDTTPPVIVIDPATPTLVNAKALTVHYTVDSVATTKTFANLFEGENTLSIEEADLAGNPTTTTYRVTVDMIGPTGLMLVNNGAASTYQNQVVLTLQAGDDGSGIEKIRIFEAGHETPDWVPFTGQMDFILSEEDGEKILQYQIKDKAGNLSDILSASITLNTTNYTKALQDGTTLVYENKVLAREITPTEDEIIYRTNGSVEKFHFKDGREILYEADLSHVLTVYDPNQNLMRQISGGKENIPDKTGLLYTTLEDGTKIYYQDGQLKEIETVGGIHILDIVFNEEQQIQDAVLVYPEGTQEIIWDGNLLRRIASDGTILDFLPGGQIVREIVQGVPQDYIFEKTSQKTFAQMRISTAEESSVYDELGILREVRGRDDAHFVYRREIDGEFFVTQLDRSVSSTSEMKSLVGGKYTKEGQIVWLLLENGTKIFFDQGKVTRAVDENNEEVDYSSLAEIEGLQVTRGGAQFRYDVSGFLNSVTTENGTLTRVQEDTNGDGEITDLDSIQLVLDTLSGYQLTDFELDEDGNLLDGILETESGIKQYIENGVLTGFETVDGKIYDFENNEATLREWRLQDGTRVLYGGGNISEILFSEGQRLDTIGLNADRQIETYILEETDGTRKSFRDGKMISCVRPDHTQILYGASGLAEKVIFPDKTEEEIRYEKDAQGSVAAVIFNGEGVERVFDANGILKRFQESGLTAQLSNGTITKLFNRFAEISNPVFDANGWMSGELVFADGARVTLENGIMTRIEHSDGNVVRYENGIIRSIEIDGTVFNLDYAYDASGKLTDAVLRTQDDPATVFPLTQLLLNPGKFLDSEESQKIAELTPLFLSRPVSNIFSDKMDLQSVVTLPSGNTPDVYLNQSISDADRERAYTFNYDTFPEWLGIQNGSTPYNLGYLTYDTALASTNELPAETADLIDMNGDGLPDRVYMQNSSADYWWVQLNNGNDFDAPIKWTGVQSPTYDGKVTDKALGYFETSRAQVLGDLIDINGDGLPDRVLQTYKDSGYAAQAWDATSWWYVQLNNGHGFDPASESPYVPSMRKTSGVTTDPDAKFGEGSLSFDGSGGFIRAADSSAWDLSGGVWTMDFWIKKSSYDKAEVIFSQVQEGDEKVYLWVAPDEMGKGVVVMQYETDMYDSQPVITLWTSGILEPNQWQHVALVQKDRDFYIFVDGVRQYTTEPSYLAGTWPLHMNDFQSEIQIGSGRAFDGKGQSGTVPSNSDLTGLLDDFRISKGIARWTSNFTPPTAPAVGDQYTTLLLDGESVAQDGSLTPFSFWNIQPLNSIDPNNTTTDYAPYGKYAQEVRLAQSGVQALVVDLVDMDGDGLPDRVIRPNKIGSFAIAPIDWWYVQKNLGTDFADAVLWKGVDSSFETNDALGASLSSYDYSGNQIWDKSDLIDMNGDGLPDRVLLKKKNPNDANSSLDWYVQLNNDHGFDAATLWDSDVRNVPGAVNAQAGTAFHLFTGWSGTRNLYSDLVDVTGDGLPDRVTVDTLNEGTLHGTWYVEVNDGTTFKPTVAWTGVYGTNAAQSVLTQDDRNFHSLDGSCPYSDVKQVTRLQDMNGDKIPDRIIFQEGSDKWLVQYGTGTGFLPVTTMNVGGLKASAEMIATQRYDYAHVSLKAGSDISPEQGNVRVSLIGGNNAVLQTWTVSNLTTSWQDFYLPIDQGQENAKTVKVEFVPPMDGSPASDAPVYIDNVTFVALRPPAQKDWLNRMLSDETILSAINSEKTQTLAGLLGYQNADLAQNVDWQKLLSAETDIHYDTPNNRTEVRTLQGQITQIEGDRVTETIMPDGTRITYETNPTSEDGVTEQVVSADGTSTETREYHYGRVRAVSRPDKLLEDGTHVPQSSLEYSYEFCSAGSTSASCDGAAAGTEITVVYDSDSKMTERYREDHLVNRVEANGLETRFFYDEAGECVRSEIVYQGRVRQTFLHGKTDSGNTTITTEDGTIEEYNAQGVIVAHTTPEGYRYSHESVAARELTVTMRTQTVLLSDGNTFSMEVPYVTLSAPDEELTDENSVQEVLLQSYQEPSGEMAYFGSLEYVGDGSSSDDIIECDQVTDTRVASITGDGGGMLKTLVLSDGTKILFERISKTTTTDTQTNETTYQTTLLDATVFHADGTVTEYRDGNPYSVTSATGHTFSLAQEGGYLIDPNESAKFHYQQASDYWTNTVLAKWKTFTLPDTLSVRSEYTKDGMLVTREVAEGVIELYNESGKIEQVVSPDGERLVSYEYDEEGNPIAIHMEGSRRRLDLAVAKVRANVAVENEKALMKVAERALVLEQTLETKYLESRDRLLQAIGDLEAAKRNLESVKVSGKKAKNKKADAMQQVNDALNRAHAMLEQLAQDRIDALQKLSDSVRQAKENIANETARAYIQIDTEKAKVLLSLKRQEMIPVIFHWYRKILGRDPSSDEYENIIVSTDYEGTDTPSMSVPSWVFNLKQQLLTSLEYQNRSAQVNAIQSRVVTLLEAYLGMTDAEKAAYLASFGINISESVKLTNADIAAMRDWFTKQPLHFGQSAFLSLNALLADAGITVPREEMASQLILIDILTGTLTPLEKSDLVISLYAMQRVASRYGLSVTSYAMTFDALKALYEDAVLRTPYAVRFVAHINGNHYIIITNVTDTEVSYTDPGAGPEAALQTVTLSKEEFLKVWLNSAARTGSSAESGPVPEQFSGGYILSAQSVPESLPSTEYHVLGAASQMSVRGAFWFLIPIIIGVIVHAIVVAVTAVISAITAIIGGLIGGLTQIFTGLGMMLTGNFIAGFGAIWTGIGQLGMAFVLGAQAFETALVTGFALQGAVAGFITSGFATMTFVGGEIQVVGTLMNAVGFSPRLTGGVTSGIGVALGIGMLAFGNPLGIGFLAGGASGLLTQFTDLSPEIAGVISLGAAALGAFAGGVISPDISGLAMLKTALPYLSMDLASAGMTAVGNALGLDARLTGLLSIPVSAAVGQFLPQAGNGGPSVCIVAPCDNSVDILKSVEHSFLGDTIGGLVSVGMQIGLSELGLPSMAGELISGFLSGLGGTDIGKSILSKVSAGFEQFTGWISKGVGAVIDFGTKVLSGAAQITEAGFKKAIGAFSGIFSRSTQENIYQDVAGIRSGTVSVDGDIWTWQSGDSRVDYNVRTGGVNESFGVGGTAKIEGLGQDSSGNYSYSKLTYQTVTTDGTLTQVYENGSLSEWGLLYPDGTSIVSRASGPNGFDADGVLVNGDVEYRYTPKDIPGPDSEPNPDNPPVQTSAITFNIQNRQVAQKAKVETTTSGSSSGSFTTTDPIYLLANGINNTDYVWGEAPEPSRYYTALLSDLKNRDPNIKDREVVIPSLYLNWMIFRTAVELANRKDPTKDSWLGNLRKLGDTVVNRMKDAFRIISEVEMLERLGLTNGLSGVITTEMNLRYAELGQDSRERPLIALGYSGGMPALLSAIVQNNWFAPVVVGVGAALSNIAEVKDWLNAVVGLFDYLTSKVTDSKTVSNTTSWLKKVFGEFAQIPVIGKPITEVAEILTTLITGTVHGVEEAVDFMINAVGAVCDDWRSQGKITPLGIPSLAGSSTECFVNIYGEDDVLAKLKIGGKMTSFAGFSDPDQLFNVEIMDLRSSSGEKLAVADHYIYMGDTRLDYSDSSEFQESFDKASKDFVADLLAYGGTSRTSMEEFLEINKSRVRWNATKYVYEVYPLGVPQP